VSNYRYGKLAKSVLSASSSYKCTASVSKFLTLEQVFSATWDSRHGGTLRVVGLWLGMLWTTAVGDNTNGVTMIWSGCHHFLMSKATSCY